MTDSRLERAPAPMWLETLWNEIDDKTFGDSLNIFTRDAEMLFGAGHWRGRETIREKLRQFDEGMETKHQTLEFWESGPLKIVQGRVRMTSQKEQKTVDPIMAHFFYMDEHEPAQVRRWVGAVGPVKF